MRKLLLTVVLLAVLAVTVDAGRCPTTNFGISVGKARDTLLVRTPGGSSFKANTVWVHLNRQATSFAWVRRYAGTTALEPAGRLTLRPGESLALPSDEIVTHVVVFKQSTDTLMYELNACGRAPEWNSIGEWDVGFRFGNSAIDSSSPSIDFTYAGAMSRTGVFNYTYVALSSDAMGTATVIWSYKGAALRSMVLSAGGSVADHVMCDRIQILKSVSGDQVQYGGYSVR